MESLGRACIDTAQGGLRADSDAGNAALDKLAQCRQIAVLSDGLNARYADAERTLREMQCRLAQRALVAPQPPSQPYPAPTGRTPTSRAPSYGTQVAIYTDVDFYGADLAERGITLYATKDRAQRCAADTRCAAFTFNVDANRCFIKFGYGRVGRFRPLRTRG